ncbi:MAG: glycoside hydrolase family 3 N-terminal domain-containing protein [Woeseiaceae bacterium]
MSVTTADAQQRTGDIEERVASLLAQMTVAEKVGQMTQRNASGGDPVEDLRERLRAGRLGSVLNMADVDVANELQRIAVEESRLGIPLLVGRDVIHGFATVMPLPIGQAASFNPDIAHDAARIAALEAATAGINWTFAPMIDVSRDPRWGRIAESYGEDPFLTSVMGAATIAGFQGDDLATVGTIAACAKHFAGYGAAEAGRDYAATYIPEIELRNVYLAPFKAAAHAGVATFMTSFSDVNGVPATGNEFLLRQVLRDEWRYEGFVVSDWDSIRQLQVHGLTENDRDSAYAAITAGVDMEMEGDAYISNLEALLDDGKIDSAAIDAAVTNILRVKFELGLFDNPYTDPDDLPAIGSDEALATAKRAALQSVVMLQNRNGALPLDAAQLGSLAVIGPLADEPYEQLGTWIFDGDPELSVTPLAALQEYLGDEVTVRYVKAMDNSRSSAGPAFDEAVAAASASDVALLFLGEESILSGEAHSRADISLPGDQAELVRRVRTAGKPVIAVILAGRPLTLTNIVDEVDAILFAWHPGTMGGPAIADLLFGVESPSGKLPATFPRMVGQVPIYYAQRNTGKPADPERAMLIDDIPVGAAQTSVGNVSYHLDAGYKPLFAFGHGLSYTEFRYDNIAVSADEISMGEAVVVTADLTNTGDVAAEEVAQLYVRDLAGSITRPVRELKGFRRIRLEPGETSSVRFELHTDDLAFYGRDMKFAAEPGEFHVWVGGSSEAALQASFRIIDVMGAE